VYISGDGFLYNMVRILVGTLLDINEGVFPPDALPDILAAKDRLAAGRTAMAHGLYLNKVFY
jgi:tRNA pseudouridine38-40 synthase